jgi:Tfp pilus assembly protein PilO
MNLVMEMIARLLRQPYAPLLPLMLQGCLLAAVLLGIHLLLVVPAQDRLAQSETDWKTARNRLAQHVEAKRIRGDLAQVLAIIPEKRDFAPLALGITDEAKRNRVSLPALTYRVEKPEAGLVAKAIFQGSVTGRYEDLRRFIHHLETAEELLFIEDLNVVGSPGKQSESVTCTIRIVTYLRGESEQVPAS